MHWSFKKDGTDFIDWKRFFFWFLCDRAGIGDCCAVRLIANNHGTGGWPRWDTDTNQQLTQLIQRHSAYPKKATVLLCLIPQKLVKRSEHLVLQIKWIKKNRAGSAITKQIVCGHPPPRGELLNCRWNSNAEKLNFSGSSSGSREGRSPLGPGPGGGAEADLGISTESDRFGAV